MSAILEWNGDQRREAINARQRFDAWSEAARRERGYSGSMVWETTKGHEYLFRVSYNSRGRRQHKSLGPRSAATEELKARFDAQRAEAEEGRKQFDQIIDRQAAVNRALRLGRVPLAAAKILRALEARGLLGGGLKVAGTNAIYAYEAACGVTLDAALLATNDIDLLLDSRRNLFLLSSDDFPEASLLHLLKKTDRSFKQTRRTYRAENSDSYFVDLIKPQRNPPWRPEPKMRRDPDDLEAAEIEGLMWLESAPSFEETVIDERGYPLRLVAPDPRIFAIHKQWISRSFVRDPVKRVRDAEQARTVATLVRTYLPHLPFDPDELRMLPREIVDEALAALA